MWIWHVQRHSSRCRCRKKGLLLESPFLLSVSCWLCFLSHRPRQQPACSIVLLRFILTKISDLYIYMRDREILSARAWPCGAPSELLRIKVFKVNLLYRFACLRRDWDVFGARCRGFEPIPSCDHLGQTLLLLLLLLQGAANTPKNNTREICPIYREKDEREMRCIYTETISPRGAGAPPERKWEKRLWKNTSAHTKRISPAGIWLALCLLTLPQSHAVIHSHQMSKLFSLSLKKSVKK